GTNVEPYSFSFKTHREYSPEEQQRLNEMHSALRRQELIDNGIDPDAQPSADLRNITGSFDILKNNNPSPGVIFYDVHTSYQVPSDYRSYNIIDSNGDSIYSNPIHAVFGDFKISESGYLTVYNDQPPCNLVLDS